MKSLLAWLCLLSSLSAYPIDFEKIFQKQIGSLNYLDVENPPLILLFSGTPGMGKTTLSQEVEHTFQAVRIAIDDTRLFFRAEGLDYTYLEPYLFWLFDKVYTEYPNHFLIFDLIVHPFYEKVMDFASKHSAPTFLTRLVVPREIVEARIVSRGNKPEITLLRLDKNWEEYENFGMTHTFDLVFDNSEENASAAPLIEALKNL